MIFKTVESVIEFIQAEFTFQGHKYTPFAEATELNRATVKRLIEGDTKSPHLKTVLRFLDGLGYAAQPVNRKKRGRPRKRSLAVSKR